MPDARFVIQLQGDVDLATYQGVVRELKTLLNDITDHLTEGKGHVPWRWDDEAAFRAVASPNGASEDLLHSVVRQARAAFERVVTAEGRSVDWPDAVGPRARRAVRAIVRQLDRVPLITVDTGHDDPLLIEHVAVLLEFGKHGVPSERSAIDGVIDLISVRGRPQFSIAEHGTGRHVRCFVADKWFLAAKDALGKRVVVEGLIRFNRDGESIAISDVTSIWERPEEKRPIDALIGTLPDFTDGLSAGEYIRRQRSGDDSGD